MQRVFGPLIINCVSILTQPIGWVQCHTCGRIARACSGFNPRPTSRLGAGGGRSSASLFQSSPNLSVGCSRGSGIVVSILTQPLGWVQRGSSIGSFQSSPNLSAGCSRGSGIVVSILTQPIGWVKRAVAPPSFQSSPNLSVGCSRGSGIVVSILTQPLGWAQRAVPHSPFQSLPNLYSLDSAAGYAVSILTQPIGWVHLGYGSLSTASVHSRFQSSPKPLGWVQLQLSVPGSEPDAGFNPHPTSRLGASLHLWQHRCGWFQSSPN